MTKEIGLVLNRIRTSCKPCLTINYLCCCIMSRGYFIIIFSDNVLKTAKFDQFVTHDIRIRCQADFCFFHCIFHNHFPILSMQINNIHFQSVFSGKPITNLYILLGGTIHIDIFLRTNFNIKEMRIIAHFFKIVYSNGTVHPSTYQCGNIHAFST